MRARTLRFVAAFQILLLVATLLLPALAFADEPETTAPPTPTEQPSDPPAEPPPDPATPAPSAPDPTAEPERISTPEPTPAPVIVSDKADYAPGERVTLTGSNWVAGESVHIYVNDEFGSTWTRNVDVTADGSGNISDQFNLPDWLVANYVVIATGAVSGIALTTFTDAFNTATSLGSSLNPSGSGQAVTLTATVTYAQTAGGHSLGEPVTAGSVIFGEDGNPNCSGASFVLLQAGLTPNASGQVTLTTSALSVGSHTIRACYLGTGGSTGTNSSSASMTQAVNGVVTTTTTAANSTASYGDASSLLSASVIPSSGPAIDSGTVTFTVKLGLTTIGTPATSGTVTGGAASAAFSLSGIDADLYIIEAVYNPGLGFATSSGTGTLTVGQASSTTTVSCPPSVVYSGSPQTPCTVLVSGAGGLTLTPTPSYTNNTNAGTASASYTYAGDPNHSGSSGSTDFTIGKADADCTSITGYWVTYDSFSHTAAGTCEGVGTDGTLAGLDLSGTTHTAAGTYLADPWTFSDLSGNYNDQAGTVDDVIGQAVADCTISGYGGIYDALPHGASGSCTDLGGFDLPGLNLGGSFTDVPGGTADWSFSDPEGNYADDSGSVEIVINKADAVCAIDGSTTTYDANSHGASGSCTGVDAGGAAAGSSLDLGAAFTDYPGGTAYWAFTGGTNYNHQDGFVAIVINKADAVCTIDGYTGVFDNSFHGASGSCTGVDAGATAAGSTLNLGATYKFVPGGTAHWIFTGGTNYFDQSGDVAIVITTAFRIEGFFQPVDMIPAGATPRIYNSVKGGQTVPLKFRVFTLGGSEITSTTDITVLVTKVSCLQGALDPEMLPTVETGGTTLRYAGDAFIFNWAVPRGASLCYEVTVQTPDLASQMSFAGGPVDAFFRAK